MKVKIRNVEPVHRAKKAIYYEKKPFADYLECEIKKLKKHDRAGKPLN